MKTVPVVGGDLHVMFGAGESGGMAPIPQKKSTTVGIRSHLLEHQVLCRGGTWLVGGVVVVDPTVGRVEIFQQTTTGQPIATALLGVTRRSHTSW